VVPSALIDLVTLMLNLCVAGKTAIYHHFYFTAFDGICVTDDDCRQLENSYCDKKVQDKYQCACKDGFILVGNNNKCFPSKILIILNIFT
jgi:hypothetical protein